MSIALPIGAEAGADSRWRAHLVALCLLGGAILLLFFRDAADMVRIWAGSSTFNHCLLLPPIIGWLVWQRLPELKRLSPVAWAPGLLIVGAGATGWMLGEAAGVALARHAGLVLMLQGSVVALLGPAVARGLLFPIAFALFLIPAGEELVPGMQRLTAEICMALLHLAGVPAHIEGVFISTPTGYFEVAEACAGVKFLIAMIALGALVANLCFRSWRRRIAFMAAAIAIPIIANGIRAFATIYVAHLFDVDAASGFDHVVYGWFFFAIVIAAILAAGWRFFDRGIDDPWFDAADLQPVAPGASPLKSVAALAAAIAVAPIAWTTAIAAGNEIAPPPIMLPEIAGWERQTQATGRPWAPHFAGADALRTGHYRDAGGRNVDLSIAVFARQEEGREIVGFGQGAVAPEGAWAWIGMGQAPANGRLERIASHGTVREVAIFYRIGDVITGSPLIVKWETMKARLLGGPQRAVAILVSVEAPAEGISPRPAIDDFLRATGPLAPLADRAAGLQQD